MKILFLVTLLLTGCPSPVPPISNCTPLTQRCNGNVVQICSPQQRWRPEEDCSQVGPSWRCIEGADGRFGCVMGAAP